MLNRVAARWSTIVKRVPFDGGLPRLIAFLRHIQTVHLLRIVVGKVHLLQYGDNIVGPTLGQVITPDSKPLRAACHGDWSRFYFI